MKNSFNLLPSNWEDLKKVLQQPFKSMDAVNDFLKLSANNYGLELKRLDALERADTLVLFNFIRMQALALDEIFPNLQINFLDGNTPIVLNRQQLLSIMCHER